MTVEVAAWVEVREGGAVLRLPAGERGLRGPASKESASVFYNPGMGVNRDVSALLLGVLARPGWTVLDGLAASGVRGIRYGVEAGVPLAVEWNDWNPVAAQLIEENAARNGLEARVHRRNLASLLHEMVWHVVELDPYGSPAPFLDAAARAVRHGGLLGVTATDATALAGVYPGVCERRYHARPLHGELGHEVALRVLAGAAVRAGARHDVGLTPVVSHATDHYYHVVLRCWRGAQRADVAMSGLGFVHSCRACGERGVGEARACPSCGGRVQVAGPLWTGPLSVAETVDAMVARADAGAPLARSEETRALLGALALEARSPPLFFDLHKVAEREKVGSPPTASVVDALRAEGFVVGPVHFNRLGVRTDARAKDVARVVRAASAGA